VRTWGDDDAVTIVSTPEECADAIRQSAAAPLTAAQLRRIDETLAHHSWDATWSRMAELMQQASSNVA